MLTACVLLTLSLALIVIAATQFVEGAATLAYRYNLSPLAVGLTLVALGTSAPEMAITIIAAIKQKSTIALGNAIGSNVANIALVMGSMLLISPIKQPPLSRPKLIFLWASMLLTFCLFLDFTFSRIDGLLLLTLLICFFVYLYFSYQQFSHTRLKSMTYQPDLIKPYPWPRVIFGCLLLPLTAAIAVKQAVIIAKLLGMSEVAIGLTVIAIGTSLPELVTSLVSCFKGQHDMAVGNILGSNIFNLLLVLPFIGLLDPGHISQKIVCRDMPIMFLTSLSLLGLMSLSERLLRFMGLLLLISYFSYLALLVIA